MLNGRKLGRFFLIALSLSRLSLATLTGLMHSWHKVAFISLAGLDVSLLGTLALLLAAIVCWIFASAI